MYGSMKKLCVIGSLNVDLTVRLPRFHAPGETITGEGFDVYAGGKGGNQAVAAARLGADVMMVGKLGTDANGVFYQNALADNQVDLSGIELVDDVPSGVAVIEVDVHGENRIAIVQGANALVDKEQIDRLLPKLMNYDIFLFQFEIPMETVSYAARLLHTCGKMVIVDPAPAAALPEDFLSSVDYLTPNERELEQLTGMPTQDNEQVLRAGQALVERGARMVLAKLGSRGVICVYSEGMIEVPGYKVNVIDTTAAGDSFNAGFAWALAKDKPLVEAIRFANAVGALSTTGAGAQQAMPSLHEVDALMKEQRL